MLKILNYFGLYTRHQLKEARNAMLEISAIQSDLIAQLYPSKTVSFDVGYAMGAQRCAKETRKMKQVN